MRGWEYEKPVKDWRELMPQTDNCPIRKQHAVAIDLLQKLGLDTMKLEPERGGYYVYSAWNRSPVEHNGSAKTVKRGRIRISSG